MSTGGGKSFPSRGSRSSGGCEVEKGLSAQERFPVERPSRKGAFIGHREVGRGGQGAQGYAQ